MPDKSVSVVSYAAGASLAAAALIYVFAPTHTIEKKGVVGLRNQANDCFINSTLQAIAGLGELRIFLIRETHRRSIEDPAVYSQLVQPEGKTLPEWKLQGMQHGLVTQGLKDMLDALNERPISKKSITPWGFVRVLEVAFKQRISRQQQDAQEFLQIVCERLREEYRAGQRARQYARKHGIVRTPSSAQSASGDANMENEAEKVYNEEEAGVAAGVNATDDTGEADSSDEEGGFPMEGVYESFLECQTCSYKTKPRQEDFYILTLNVPRMTETSLGECLDGIFRQEIIEDFKCENCRLLVAKENYQRNLEKSTSDKYKAQAKDAIQKLEHTIKTDPEEPPEGVDLGDIRYAPKRKIARYTRMAKYPKILVVHLSRSIHDGGMTNSSMQKNTAKVSFPERFPLGGIFDNRPYKLVGTVTHKGGHNSGHYESFRRQIIFEPYSNPNTFLASEVYSKTASPAHTPQIGVLQNGESPTASTPDLLSTSSSRASPAPSVQTQATKDQVPSSKTSSANTVGDREAFDAASLKSTAAASARSNPRKSTDAAKETNGDTASSEEKGSSDEKKSAVRKDDPVNKPQPAQETLVKTVKPVRRKKTDKWWRISDEKVRECRTSETLGMQREVYLLFYELEKQS